ncbi:MAG: hypothetical protein JW846_05715 [Dehalococcoidia bacterium]|nr:hypothetical protein [Dehalococcoidia bacterium]
MSKPPDVAPVEPLCGTKPFLSEDEHKRQIEKYADHRPSISVSLDGRERIHAEGKSPARPPSAASLAKKMRFLVEEDKSRGQHEK